MVCKDDISFEKMIEILNKLGADPRPNYEKEEIVNRTICHHPHDLKGSHKLYYYNNTHLFHCYTQCVRETFDIFYLVSKVKQISMLAAHEWVSLECGVPFFPEEQREENNGWSNLNRFKQIQQIPIVSSKIDYKVYDGSFLGHLPHPIIQPWVDEGIDQNVMERRGICYNPISGGVVIPHYNISGDLIGVRERTLVKENEKYGKYRPLVMNNKIYNHPLGLNLYNLNWSKDNIKTSKSAIIGEGEKFCLTYASLFGEDNDITVATCGSSFSKAQFQFLLSLGVREITLAFDRQFKQIGDEEYERWIKKLQNIAKKYKNFCSITFMFDTQGLLDYKDSPIDKGKEVFQQMFDNRLNCEGRIRT